MKATRERLLLLLLYSNIYFPRFSDGEGKTQAADHEILRGLISDI
jgi:hypothetical protein